MQRLQPAQPALRLPASQGSTQGIHQLLPRLSARQVAQVGLWGCLRVNYYEHHIGDYAAATGHLTLVEDAAAVGLVAFAGSLFYLIGLSV